METAGAAGLQWRGRVVRGCEAHLEDSLEFQLSPVTQSPLSTLQLRARRTPVGTSFETSNISSSSSRYSNSETQ